MSNDLERNAQALFNATAEVQRASEDLKAKNAAVEHARERLEHLRKLKSKAAEELYREALGPDLAKADSLYWS